MGGCQRFGRWMCVWTSVALLALAGGASAEPSGSLGPFEWDLEQGPYYEDSANDFRLDLDGRFALDWVEWDDRNARSTQLRMDRALLGLQARLGDFHAARVVLDLDGIDTRGNLWEAWAALSPGDYARVTVGLMPIAFSLEQTLGEAASPLPGYHGFPAFLTGRHDWALRLDGEIADGLLYYEFTGAVGEGYDLHGQGRGDPQLGARVMSYPGRMLDQALEIGPYTFPLFSGWFVNFGYAISDDYDGHLDVATPMRNKVFDSQRLDGKESSFWLLTYGVDLGPIRAFHEITRGSIEDVRLPGGGRRDFDDQISSWQAVVSWRITGEPYDSRPYRGRDALRPDAPARPVNGEGDERGCGMWELAFRYANADIDRDFISTGLTTPALSSQEFRQAAVALNWYPTSTLRVSLQVVRILADQDPAVFGFGGRDTSGFLRAEVHF